MKLFRGREDTTTDEKQPSDYIANWKSSGFVELRGTKSREASRETTLWLRIDEEDVLAFSHALIERYLTEIPTLRADNAKLRAEIRNLKRR